MQESAAKILKAKSVTRGLVSNIWAHDIAQRLKMRRQVVARDSGLGEIDVGTYPSHGAVHVDNGGFWKGLAVAGLAAGGLGAASTLLTPPVEAVVQPPVAVEARSQEWDLDIISVDGKPVVNDVSNETE
jgi:hypothetical protein